MKDAPTCARLAEGYFNDVGPRGTPLRKGVEGRMPEPTSGLGLTNSSVEALAAVTIRALPTS